jgi:putative toxin-antitoxin system antitoxin component (TIGR02293 family)
MEALDIDVENEFTLLMSGRRGARADELIRQGVPLAALDRLAKHGVDVVRLGIIKPRTLSHRRSRGETLSAEEGDRLYRASKIILLAEQVFGSQEKAGKWLQKPKKTLGGISALEAIATTPGFAAAEELLEQLRYGFTA